MQLYWKAIWWLLRAGIFVWFVAVPILALYGWLSPWPEAEQALDAEGINGTLLLIGSGSSSERNSESWSEERQRSYIAFPAFLRSMEILVYTESKGSHIVGIERKLVRNKFAIPFLVIWILAGWVSIMIAMSWFNKTKKPNQGTERIR
jgi:hypothetical protein